MSSFIEIENQKLHFYTMGNGPALVMFHASPSSGEALVPLANHLTSKYTVFVLIHRVMANQMH